MNWQACCPYAGNTDWPRQLGWALCQTKILQRRTPESSARNSRDGASCSTLSRAYGSQSAATKRSLPPAPPKRSPSASKQRREGKPGRMRARRRGRGGPVEGLGETYRRFPQHPCSPQGAPERAPQRPAAGHSPAKAHAISARSPLPTRQGCGQSGTRRHCPRPCTRHIATDEGPAVIEPRCPVSAGDCRSGEHSERVTPWE
jgi:hypothetical protein